MRKGKITAKFQTLKCAFLLKIQRDSCHLKGFGMFEKQAPASQKS